MSKEILSGIRVLDFGAFMAGPVAGMILAQLGAEVIKVENRNRPEGARFFINAPNAPTPDPKYGGQFFDVSNMNKKSITVDFKTPEGKKIILDLVAKSDILIENITAGSMAKHGLGYEDMKLINPKLVYISSCACGQTGPEKYFMGYAAHFANKAGLGHITGYTDYIPSQFTGSMDIRSGVNTVIASLASLSYREISGEGQYCDLSSQEVMASQLGDVYLDYILNDRVQIRDGNRRQGYAPNNLYRCTGEDRWVSISVASQEEWKCLCKAIEQPELMNDIRFESYEKRFKNYQELDDIISAWTSDKDIYTATRILQESGVPSSPSLSGDILHDDPHVIDRGFFEYIDHPTLGKDFVTGVAWRFSETPAKNKRHAPALGEHTEEILTELLGRGKEEVEDLKSKGVI